MTTKAAQPLTVSCRVERVQLSPAAYTYRRDSFEVEPVRLIRSPCGTIGAARTRYNYSAEFAAPEGVIGLNDEGIAGQVIRENIVRRKNPRWKPPREGWSDNVWTPPA